MKQEEIIALLKEHGPLTIKQIVGIQHEREPRVPLTVLRGSASRILNKLAVYDIVRRREIVGRVGGVDIWSWELVEE